MKDTVRIFWAFLVRDFNMEISYRFNFLMQIVSLFFSVISLYFVSRLVGRHPELDKFGGYLPFSIVGMATSTIFSIGLSSFSSAIRNEQMMGTLEAVLMTPARLPLIVLASSGWSYLWALLNAAAVFLFSWFFLGVRLQGDFLCAILLIFLTAISFSCIGIISAAFIMVFKRGSPFNYLVASSSLLLGGVIYPVSALPHWLQRFSSLLPVTHGLVGIRKLLLLGMPVSAVLPQILVLSVFAVVGVPVSLYCFRRALGVARREGSLLHY